MSVADLLDRLVEAAKASQYADVAANGCNTRQDHEAAHRAADRLAEVYDDVAARLGAQRSCVGAEAVVARRARHGLYREIIRGITVEKWQGPILDELLCMATADGMDYTGTGRELVTEAEKRAADAGPIDG